MRHMRTIALKTSLLAVSGLGILVTSAPAIAGGCGYGSTSPHCQMGSSVNLGQAPSFGPMSVNVQQPMGYLRSVNYQRAPNVSITRVHGMMPSASVSDFPSRFTGGCHPSSTTYCRQDQGTPVDVVFNTPQVSAAPQFSAPQINVPSFNYAAVPSAPRVVAVGGGYDPSKFTPRVYGDNTLTPGIAHVPTSFVDRSPINAANALASARVSTTSYGSMNLSPSYSTTGHQILSTGSQLAGGLTSTQNLSLATTASNPFPSGNPVISTGSSNPTSPVDSTGGYWEQVSGLTAFGDTIATSVVCRRQAPAPAPVASLTRVVRPVIGVRQAVPTPVPYFVDVPVRVRAGQIPSGCRPMGTPYRAPTPQFGPGFGGGFGGGFGRGPGQGWTY